MENNKEESDGPFCTKLPNDDFLLAVGKFVVTFTHFEDNVVQIMSLMYGCEPEAIGNIAYALDLNKRCQLLRGIIAYRLGSFEKTEEGLNLKRDNDMKNINTLFKKVHDAVKRRNLIVHSNWLTDEKTGKPHRLSQKGKQITGYPGGEIKCVDASEIDKDTEFVSNTSEELWKYFWDNFGHWILERAQNSK